MASDPSVQEGPVETLESPVESPTERPRVTLESILEANAPAQIVSAERPRFKLPERRLGTGALLSLTPEGLALVQISGVAEPLECEVSSDLEVTLLETALDGDAHVMIEDDGLRSPRVTGVIAVRAPRTLTIKADTLKLEGTREVTLQSGRSAVRLREDGDVEVVGGRISATSRGLFRIVGKLLRLN